MDPQNNNPKETPLPPDGYEVDIIHLENLYHWHSPTLYYLHSIGQYILGLEDIEIVDWKYSDKCFKIDFSSYTFDKIAKHLLKYPSIWLPLFYKKEKDVFACFHSTANKDQVNLFQFVNEFSGIEKNNYLYFIKSNKIVFKKTNPSNLKIRPITDSQPLNYDRDRLIINIKDQSELNRFTESAIAIINAISKSYSFFLQESKDGLLKNRGIIYSPDEPNKIYNKKNGGEVNFKQALIFTGKNENLDTLNSFLQKYFDFLFQIEEESVQRSLPHARKTFELTKLTSINNESRGIALQLKDKNLFDFLFNNKKKLFPQKIVLFSTKYLDRIIFNFFSVKEKCVNFCLIENFTYGNHKEINAYAENLLTYCKLDETKKKNGEFQENYLSFMKSVEYEFKEYFEGNAKKANEIGEKNCLIDPILFEKIFHNTKAFEYFFKWLKTEHSTSNDKPSNFSPNNVYWDKEKQQFLISYPNLNDLNIENAIANAKKTLFGDYETYWAENSAIHAKNEDNCVILAFKLNEQRAKEALGVMNKPVIQEYQKPSMDIELTELKL